MNKLARLQLLSIGLLVGSLAFPALIWGQDMEWLKKGVVVIEVSGKTGTKGYGTGFIVRRELGHVLIVTASHVVEGKDNIYVEFYTDKNTPQVAKLLQMEGNDSNGLAVLAVPVDPDKHDLSVLPFNSKQQVNSGDQVTILGFPKKLNIKWATTKGQIIGRSGKQIKFSGLVDEGNSGGPLLKDNQVIGVVTERLFDFSHAVPAQIAQYVLESWDVRFGVILRSQPASLSMSYISQMITKYGFHHPTDLSAIGLSPSVLGTFQHEYERKTLEEGNVVVDRATGLMWQQYGSKEAMDRSEATDYIRQINQERFAGFADWRLPTVEELASLLEPSGRNDRVYIHEFFFPLLWCWTADDVTVQRKSGELNFRGKEKYPDALKFYDVAILIDFSAGAIITTETVYGNTKFHVRAVRTINPEIQN